MRVLLATLAVALSAAFVPPASGAGEDAADFSDQERQAIQRVEDYLAGIDTLHAEFLQTASNGTTARGKVWVDRPGKMRFEYEPPHPALLVSNGTLLLYFDRELRETTYVPLSETPLWFLIRAEIDISKAKGYRVVQVDQGKGTLRIKIAQKGSKFGDPGSVMLTFEDKPLQLKKWRIVDQQGVVTEVALINPQFGTKIDQALFDFGELDLPRFPSGSRGDPG